MNKEQFDKGLEVRRAVLGADYVDAALRNADEFTMPIQEFVTEYGWGAVWTRPAPPAARRRHRHLRDHRRRRAA